MNGKITGLTDIDTRGDTLIVPALATDEVLAVKDITDFEEDTSDGSYWLTIADSAPIEYIGIDEDANTVTLAAAVGAAYEAGDPVNVWDPSVPPSGAKVVDYVVPVMTDRGPIEGVTVEHETIVTAGVDSLDGASVRVDVDDHGNPYVSRIYSRTPVLDGAFIDPTSTIPGGQAFSLDAPTATDGYPEDYGWWQVDATGNVLGFWRLVGGVWTAQTIVTQAALQVGNILVDALNGETITGVTVTGSTVQTATSGARWKMTSAAQSELTGYSGGASESLPGSISTGVTGGDYYVNITPPVFTGVADIPLVQLLTRSGGSSATLSNGNASLNMNGSTSTFSGGLVWNSGGAWATYTPTFTAATTNPTLGSFTRAGRWSQWGKTIRFSIVITATAASGYGTGTYEFGLPVAARAADEVVVTAAQSGPNHGYIGRPIGGSTTAVSLLLSSTDAAINSVNSGMATGTILRISGTYEAA